MFQRSTRNIFQASEKRFIGKANCTLLYTPSLFARFRNLNGFYTAFLLLLKFYPHFGRTVCTLHDPGGMNWQ